jgi:hypothetical protein
MIHDSWLALDSRLREASVSRYIGTKVAEALGNNVDTLASAVYIDSGTSEQAPT